MYNNEILTRLGKELENREIEQEIECREEFTMLVSVPKAPEAPEVPVSPKNPFPDMVCPFIYW